MYLPRAFDESRPEALQALMRAHPFATLLTVADGLPEADHLPLHWAAARESGAPGDADALPGQAPGQAPGALPGLLRGHVARANPLWRRLGDGVPALAVFHGPQGYVSPGWYPSKREHGKAVPTWNYVVVHARGTLRAVDDPAWLASLLAALSERHEAGRPEPWRLADAPAGYIAQMLRAVVGIELRIESLQGKCKLSQNRDEADRAGVLDGLAAEPGGDAQALRRAMQAAR